MDREGTNLKQLTHFDGSYAPQWSPDSQKIIFLSYGPRNLFDPRIWQGVDRKFAIWTVDIDGENLRQLIPGHSKGNHSPSWSPDGNFIVWNRGSHLWMADSRGRNVRPLTPSTSDYNTVSRWSADSQTIYVSDGDQTQKPNPQCTTQTLTAINLNDLSNLRKVQQPFKPILQEQTGSFRYCVDQGKLFKVDSQERTSQLVEFTRPSFFESATVAPNQKTLIVGFRIKGGLYNSIWALKLKEQPSKAKF